MAEALFPMRLETFDQMMLDDDHPRYPMTYLQCLEFSGEVQVDLLKQAIVDALGRHPMLTAQVGLDRKSRRVWYRPESPLPPVIDCAAYDAPMVPPPRARLRLSREPGVRTFIRSGGGKTRVLFLFHHACTDGLGSFRFIGDCLALYDQAAGTGPERAQLVALEPERLKTRSEAMRHGPDRNAKIPNWTELLVTTGRMLTGRSSTKLAAPEVPYPERWRQEFPTAVLHTFNAKEYQALRQAAESQGAFTNDLLIAAMFRVLSGWNAVHRPKGKRPVRIMMPVNMRGPGDERMPAANVVSLCFLERTMADCQNRDELLRSVCQETLKIRNESTGIELIQALTIAEALPGLIKFVLRGNDGLSTCIVSNTGDPTRVFNSTFQRSGGKLVAGNLVLETIYGVPPLRRGARLSLGVQVYNRSLILSMRMDPFRFKAEDVRHFMDLLLEELKQTAEHARTAQ